MRSSLLSLALRAFRGPYDAITIATLRLQNRAFKQHIVNTHTAIRAQADRINVAEKQAHDSEAENATLLSKHAEQEREIAELKGLIAGMRARDDIEVPSVRGAPIAARVDDDPSVADDATRIATELEPYL